MNKKIFLGLITVSLLSANRTFAQSYMTEHQLDSLENSWAAMQDTLKNVEVVAQKRIVKVESDKITYSVKDDSDAKTNNVLDMLRKVPMVTVDGQDNIKVNGSSSFKVYVNGKPNAMISSNPSTILKAMPASVVKNIEVVTNPGAKYDAEGTGGILNITMLTDSSMEGYLANIYAIGGNRVNGGGVYSTIQKKKVTVSLNVGDNYLIQPKIEIENQYDNMATATKQTFKSLTKGWTNSINANTDISVDVDSLNSFSVNGGVSFTPQHTWSDALTDIRGAQNSNYSTHSNNRTRNNNFFAGADYKHNFRGGNGHSLMLAYRLSSQPTRTESESEYSVAYMPAYSEINRSNMVENTLQADYNLPLSSTMRLETGAKYIFRRNTSNTSLLNYRNANDIGALYASYGYNYKMLSSKAGVRYEHTSQKITGTENDFSIGYDNIVPTVTFGLNLKNMQNLGLSYNMRISRPGISLLNPYVNTQNPTMLEYGNPNLEAEKIHNIQLSYGMFSQKVMINASLRHNFQNNSIEKYSFSENDVMHTTYGNIAKKRNTSLNLFCSVTLTPKTKAMINGSVSYADLRSDVLGYSNSGWQGSIMANIQQDLWWKLKLSLFCFTNTPEFKLQGKSPAISVHGLNLSKSLCKDRVNLSVNTINPFASIMKIKDETRGADFSSISDVRVNMRSVIFTANIRLGNLKPKSSNASRISNEDVKEAKDSGINSVFK